MTEQNDLFEMKNKLWDALITDTGSCSHTDAGLICALAVDPAIQRRRHVACQHHATCSFPIKPLVFCKPCRALRGARQAGFEEECMILEGHGECPVIRLIEVSEFPIAKPEEDSE